MGVTYAQPSRVLMAAPGRALLRAAAAASAPVTGGGGGGGGFGGALPTFTAANILCMGQSNAFFALDPSADNQGVAIVQGVTWYLRATGAYLGSGGGTLIGGQGLYVGDGANTIFPGSFLTDPGDGSSPSTWQIGTDGQDVQTYINGLTTAQRAGIVGIYSPFSENDSARAYADKATFEAAWRRWMALVRGWIGGAAANLPWFQWSAMPFGLANDQGPMMHREVMYELAADPTQNLTVALPQTADADPRGSTYDAVNGTWSGGDSDHLDTIDNITLTHRVVLPMARAIVAAAGGAATAIPAALGSGLGPQITAATISGSVVTVTVQHDAGTDLLLPLQAAAGAGWTVMSGGSIGSPGTLIQATACARVDATHLAVTLASTPPSGTLTLFYPYGNGRIGRGDAVTDNAASVARPVGWDIGAALGGAWDVNLPLRAPVTVTAGVAAAGIPVT